MIKKEEIVCVLKQILVALKNKDYDNICKYVTSTDLVELSELPSFLNEYIQGTVELNGFEQIDEFSSDNYCDIDDSFDDKVEVEYILTADGGHELPLCLSIEVSSEDVFFSIYPC